MLDGTPILDIKPYFPALRLRSFGVGGWRNLRRGANTEFQQQRITRVGKAHTDEDITKVRSAMARNDDIR